MSLHAVVDVALHFESFRNVDLFHQGLYHLKSRLYREDGRGKVLATPYNIFTRAPQEEEAPKKSTRTDHHHLIPAHIIEDQYTFSTRSFLIRYCEEEVEVDDVVQFRVELSPEVLDSEVTLILEVDLMFADLTNHGGADRFGEQPAVDSTEFKSVSTQLYRLHRVTEGLHEFCPIVFDEFHFCLANLVVHSSVLDFRFRVRPVDLVFSYPKPPTVQGKSSSDGAAGPPVAAAHIIEALPAVVSRGARPALSLAEWLFSGCSGDRDELLDTVEQAYDKHIGMLVASHARQAEWFEMICQRCLTKAYREALGDLIEVPQLVLPAGMSLLRSKASPSASSAGVLTGQSSLRLNLSQRMGPGASEQTLAMFFLSDLNAVSCQLLELWSKELNLIMSACREMAAFLRMVWEEQIVDQWSVTVFRETVSGDLPEPEDKSIGLVHDLAADKARATLKAKAPERVEDLALFPTIETRPMLFVQRYMPKHATPRLQGYSPLPVASEGPIPSAPKEYRGAHLFVLVHGFQGNSFDMRLMKNNLALLYPEAIFLCSNSNEDNTEGDFNDMGHRLAQEVVNYIVDWCPGGALGRLSFIAHSIGGLIVRSALPSLQEYRHKMFTFLTFSTPHVGYFLKNISLFHVGLRVLQSWRQSQCLSQLSMADSPDPKETLMFRLSQMQGFEFFQNVVLVSCPSDQYSPFDSARVEIGGMLDKHSYKDVYCEMVRHIWEHVKPERVFRIDVNFHIPENNLDTFIGRAAHILFLECQATMKLVIHNYSFLFR